MQVEIEIFSDVICPWCFIGKRRLDQVLSSDSGRDVSVRWRPYQLYPNIPPSGYARQEYLARRYGDAADVARVPERIVSEATQENIPLRYDLIERMPNTLSAHRLIEWSYPTGRQHDLVEALFSAYFCNGADVGDVEVLVGCATSLGLDEAEVRHCLVAPTDTGINEVQTQLARALDAGITGVPGYLFAGGFLLPGAQSVLTMQQILKRVKEKLLVQMHD